MKILQLEIKEFQMQILYSLERFDKSLTEIENLV